MPSSWISTPLMSCCTALSTTCTTTRRPTPPWPNTATRVSTGMRPTRRKPTIGLRRVGDSRVVHSGGAGQLLGGHRLAQWRHHDPDRGGHRRPVGCHAEPQAHGVSNGLWHLDRRPGGVRRDVLRVSLDRRVPFALCDARPGDRARRVPVLAPAIRWGRPGPADFLQHRFGAG